MSENWVVENLEKALERWNYTLGKVWEIATISPQDFQGGAIWEKISTVSDGIKAVAYALIVLFFVAGIVKTCSAFTEMRRPELVFKIFIRFALTKAAVENAMELMIALTDIMQGIIDSVMEAAFTALPESAELPQEIIQAIEDTDFISSIPLWAVGLASALAVWVLSFVLILTVYGRFFRIFMYTAIAPIPIAAFAGQPSERIGISFIKSYAGVCLEGAIVVLACIIFSIFVSEPTDVNTDVSAVTMVWEYMGQLIFNMLILVGCVKMSDRLVREMLGL